MVACETASRTQTAPVGRVPAKLVLTLGEYLDDKLEKQFCQQEDLIRQLFANLAKSIEIQWRQPQQRQPQQLQPQPQQRRQSQQEWQQERRQQQQQQDLAALMRCMPSTTVDLDGVGNTVLGKTCPVDLDDRRHYPSIPGGNSTNLEVGPVPNFADSTNVDSRCSESADLPAARSRTKASLTLGRTASTLAKYIDQQVAAGKKEECCVRAVSKGLSGLRWWKSLREPSRSGCMAKFVQSRLFDVIATSVILANASFAIYSTNYDMENWKTGPLNCDSRCHSIRVLEGGFLAVYTTELMLKIAVHRQYYFCNTDMQWNWFDLMLVLFAAYDQLALFVLSEGSGSSVNLIFMRTLRVMKMAKILRVVRVMRFFTELRLMLNSILGSFMSLIWSLLMLLFIFYIFSLFFVQSTVVYLSEHGDDLDEHELHKFLDAFGSVQSAMLSLFKSISGGADWEVFYDGIISRSPMSAVFWWFFIAFIQVALMNILTGIFVDNAMKLAMPDRESLARERLKQENFEEQELYTLFKDMDTDDDGKISSEEFADHVSSAKFKAHLAVLGLDIKDAYIFFNMLSAISEDNCAEIAILVDACMRLKGMATSFDLHNLLFQTKVLRRSLEKFQAECLEQFEKIKLKVDVSGKTYGTYRGERAYLPHVRTSLESL